MAEERRKAPSLTSASPPPARPAGRSACRTPGVALAPRSLAVTGAGGFIGAALCARLTGEGRDVLGLDIAPGAAARAAEAGAEFRAVDVTDPEALAAALAGRDGVIHTAAIVSDQGSMADHVRVNVRGTRNVLAAAAGEARVVHLSSVASWGYEFPDDLAEDAEPRACGVPYVDTKAASDLLARRAGAAVVRPGDVYGPGSIPWSVRPLETLRAGVFVLPGRGEGLMTPVYIDDLVDCVVRALDHPQAGGQAFTAWDGHPVTAADFIGHYARMLGRDRVPTAPRALVSLGALALELGARVTGRPPAVSRTAITFIDRRATYPNTRAREVLGWEPAVDLEEGMRRTEAWFRETGLLP